MSNASQTCQDSERSCFVVMGFILHWEAGRARKLLTRQTAYKLMTEPATAIASMGIRIAAPWTAAMNLSPAEAAASEPMPMSSRSPLIAMKAVHAL